MNDLTMKGRILVKTKSLVQLYLSVYSTNKVYFDVKNIIVMSGVISNLDITVDVIMWKHASQGAIDL